LIGGLDIYESQDTSENQGVVIDDLAQYNCHKGKYG
jgi:hypothetical protein